MGRFKNDQVTRSNIKDKDVIDELIKEINKLRLEVIELRNKVGKKGII